MAVVAEYDAVFEHEIKVDCLTIACSTSSKGHLQLPNLQRGIHHGLQTRSTSLPYKLSSLRVSTCSRSAPLVSLAGEILFSTSSLGKNPFNAKRRGMNRIQKKVTCRLWRRRRRPDFLHVSCYNLRVLCRTVLCESALDLLLCILLYFEQRASICLL